MAGLEQRVFQKRMVDLLDLLDAEGALRNQRQTQGRHQRLQFPQLARIARSQYKPFKF